METPGDDPRISRRRALKRAAAVGAAVWVTPAIQSVNMTRAWAQVGSDPPGHDPRVCYSVDIDINPYGAVSIDDDAPFRCVSPKDAWTGGASIFGAVYDGIGGWVVSVNAQGAEITEGVAKGRDKDTDPKCNPGTPAGTNAMHFTATTNAAGKVIRVRDVELTFCIPVPPEAPAP